MSENGDKCRECTADMVCEQCCTCQGRGHGWCVCRDTERGPAFLGGDHADIVLHDLRKRIGEARTKHPDGPSMMALLEEVIEAQDALFHFLTIMRMLSTGRDIASNDELTLLDDKRLRYYNELLDIATVTVRLAAQVAETI